MSGKTHGWKPKEQHFIAGFWRPEKGSSVVGVMVEKAETPNAEYFVLQVTKPIKVVSRDQRSGDEIERKAKEGEEIGISIHAGLRGLEETAGHEVTITCKGKEKFKLRDGTESSRYVFEVEVSDQVKEPRFLASGKDANGGSSNGSGRGRRPRKGSRSAPAPESATDEDIPF